MKSPADGAFQPDGRLTTAVGEIWRTAYEGAMEELDPIRVAPNNYTVVFENARVRVLAFHGPPKAKWGLHAHPDAVVVSLNEYVVRNVVVGAEPTVRQAKAGDVTWSPAKKHTGENIGSTDMDCILVELKEQR